MSMRLLKGKMNIQSVHIKVPSDSVFIVPMTTENMGDTRFIGVAVKETRKTITVLVCGRIDDLSRSVFKKDWLNEFRDMRE